MAAVKVDKETKLLDQNHIAETRAEHRYNKVPAVAGKGLKISSAEKYWKEHPGAIFVPLLRVVGDEAAILALLNRANAGHRLREIVDSGYSLRTLANPAVRAAFEAEVAAAKAHKEAKVQSTFSTAHLLQWHNMGRPPKAEKSKASPRSATGSPRGGGGHPANLAAVLAEAVKVGKVRNVSKMSENGAHSKSEARRGAKSKFRELPEVPGLVSDNVATYARALQLLNKSPEEVAALSAKFASLLQPQVSALQMPVTAAPIIAAPLQIPSFVAQVPQVPVAARVSPRRSPVAAVAPIVPPVMTRTGTSPRTASTNRSPMRVVQPVVPIQQGAPSQMVL